MPDPIKFFYDVPVYRLPADEYYRQRKRYIEDNLFPPNLPYRNELIAEDQADPKPNSFMRDHLAKSYGGMWQFNEIIGYIRLHFLGTQVRGEYYAVLRKRIVRTRQKVLEYHTWKLVPEREVWDSSSSDKIYSVILDYIEDCRSELKNRYIDSSILESIGPYVDWKALYDA